MKKSLFSCFIAGLIFATGYPLTKGYQFFPGALIGMTIFFWHLGIFHELTPRTKKWWYPLLHLFTYAFGQFLLGYYWIPYTLEEFGNIPFPFNYMLGVSFTIIILPHLFTFLLAVFLAKKYLPPKYRPAPNSLWAILLAMIATLVEYYIPQQFPTHFGHPVLQAAPYIGLAPYFGVPAFSFFSYLICFTALVFFKTKKYSPVILASILIFILTNIFMPLPDSQNGNKKKISVRLVQPNIGNFLKLSSEKGNGNSLEEVYQRYIRLSTSNLNKPPQLIIWPETAFPDLQYSKALRVSSARLHPILRTIIDQTKSPLFFGGYDQAKPFYFSRFETEYNAAFLLKKNFLLSDVYHKMKLIPFGEGLPFGPFNKALSKYITNISYFASGTKFTLFELEDGTRFTSAICYEILFSEFIRTYFNSLKSSPHFIINMTNDSWYGKTNEPYQHMFLSHWRAVEFQLPIIRITNTGFTSILYPDGGESRRTKLFVEDVMDLKMPVALNPKKTLFQRIGILGLFFLFGLVLVGQILFQKLRPSRG